MTKSAYRPGSRNPLYVDRRFGSGGNAGGQFIFEAAGGESTSTTAYRGAILQLDGNFLLQLDGSLLLKLENG